MKEPHEMRPGNRYARERGFGRTLGQLAEDKMALVAVCPRCKHRKTIYLPALVERFGADFAVLDLRSKLRCSDCKMSSPNLHESAR